MNEEWQEKEHQMAGNMPMALLKLYTSSITSSRGSDSSISRLSALEVTGAPDDPPAAVAVVLSVALLAI